MRCDAARAAISASIDEEVSGLPDGAVNAHLGDCAGCRAWQQRAHAVTRRIRLGGAFLDHDLAPRVLAAVSAGSTARRPGDGRRAGRATTAAAQDGTLPVDGGGTEAA